jgi:transposase
MVVGMRSKAKAMEITTDAYRARACSRPYLRGGSVSNDALLPDFDRLAERVKTVIGQDPLGNGLFVFRSRSGDRLKILAWDRDGFVLWYKRLEAGVFKLPRVNPGSRSVELRASELAMILDGIDMTKLKRVPRYERGARTISDNKATAMV